MLPTRESLHKRWIAAHTIALGITLGLVVIGAQGASAGQLLGVGPSAEATLHAMGLGLLWPVLATGLLAGTLIGLGQWLVLRRCLGRSALWPLLTALGVCLGLRLGVMADALVLVFLDLAGGQSGDLSTAISSTLAVILPALLAGTCAGAFAGLLQPWALGRGVRLSQSWVWPHALGGAAAVTTLALMSFVTPDPQVLPSTWLVGALIGVLAGAVAGAAFALVTEPSMLRLVLDTAPAPPETTS